MTEFLWFVIVVLVAATLFVAGSAFFAWVAYRTLWKRLRSPKDGSEE